MVFSSALFLFAFLPADRQPFRAKNCQQPLRADNPVGNQAKTGAARRQAQQLDGIGGKICAGKEGSERVRTGEHDRRAADRVTKLIAAVEQRHKAAAPSGQRKADLRARLIRQLSPCTKEKLHPGVTKG